MLVLTRKADEEIVIGDSIRVRVGQISGNRVRLIIDAPADVEIKRSELLERVLGKLAFEEPVAV